MKLIATKLAPFTASGPLIGNPVVTPARDALRCVHLPRAEQAGEGSIEFDHGEQMR